MPYAKALKKAQCERVETTIRKRCLLCAGWHTSGDQSTADPPDDVRDEMAGEENPGPGRPETNWARDVQQTTSLMFFFQLFVLSLRGVHGNLPSAVRSTNGVMAEGGYKKSKKWHRVVVEAADCCSWRGCAGTRHRGAGYET